MDDTLRNSDLTSNKQPLNPAGQALPKQETIPESSSVQSPSTADATVQTYSTLSNALNQGGVGSEYSVNQNTTSQPTPVVPVAQNATPPIIPPETAQPTPLSEPTSSGSQPFGSQPDSPPMQPAGGAAVNNFMSTTTAKPGNGSKFKILIIFLLLVAIAIYGGVAYLYFTNDKMKPDGASNETQNTQPVPTDAITPVPTTALKNINIESGSIVETTVNGAKTTLIDKKDYPDSGIGGFFDVNVSPDDTHMCFYSIPPALGPMLYYSLVDGSGVVEIAERVRSCVWSNNANFIAYTNDADTSEPVNIYAYNLSTKQSTNLTNATASSIIRRYEIKSWSADDAKILCNYESIDLNDTTKETTGNCEINVATSKVTDL